MSGLKKESVVQVSSPLIVKIILIPEPGTMEQNCKTIRNISGLFYECYSIKTIGVEHLPCVFDTPDGRVVLIFWVVSFLPFFRPALPVYYRGAIRYIFMCSSVDSIDFLSEILDETIHLIDTSREIIILIPKKGEKGMTVEQRTAFASILHEHRVRNFSFFEWNDSNNLNNFFHQLARDLNIAHQGTVLDLASLEQLISELGFEVTNDHEVLQTLGNITFRINLRDNKVHAEITHCHKCSSNCKMSKDLCIQIAEKGFSTVERLGDLRVLSTLFAIKEGTIMEIKGNNPREDLRNQIGVLVKKWRRDCKRRITAKTSHT